MSTTTSADETHQIRTDERCVPALISAARVMHSEEGLFSAGYNSSRTGQRASGGQHCRVIFSFPHSVQKMPVNTTPECPKAIFHSL
jgi:hypothetical protein